jgi:hypothetical protein
MGRVPPPRPRDIVALRKHRQWLLEHRPSFDVLAVFLVLLAFVLLILAMS